MTVRRPAAASPFQLLAGWLRGIKDLVITLLLWVYFIAGFAVLFGPFYLLSFCFSQDRNRSFQKLNHLFFNSFFTLCQWFIPGTKWDIPSRVRNIRSAIIVCNHLSYLDSILLVSLYPRHTTIAKDRLYYIPILGKVAQHAGYIPSSGHGRCAELLLNSLEAISATLEQGGNIIVFPKGTRSRDGSIGKLHKGAFKIAKYCKAPVKVLKISNTDKLFPPGKFLLNTCKANIIRLQLIGELLPRYEKESFDVKELMTEVRALLGGNSS